MLHHPTPAEFAAWDDPAHRSSPTPDTHVVRSRLATADPLLRSRDESSPGSPRRTAVHTACSVSSRPTALTQSIVMGLNFNRCRSACPAGSCRRSRLDVGNGMEGLWLLEHQIRLSTCG
jgi:hypothetical protein